MQFATSIFTVLACATAVNAHGHLIKPIAIMHTGAPQGNPDIRIPAQGCGAGVTISGKAAATFKAGSSGTTTWSMTNGDGGGPLSVSFDTTGKGTSFKDVAKITKNLEGVNGGVSNEVPRGPHDIIFTVPKIKCTGCVMQVRQNIQGKDGFGSCVVVDIV
ncbi:uncharacterized protein RSE6_03149 [Rhynchosporium secalis]|uniref:GEgh 16 protein n=1 Tax=Rhynchosporium secalis TaxID=38038 RepID=A0A1E1M3I4_RHYSE|nr:uncharacterized protein RSE6_03149 [Rhynchosporium secalis]